MDGSEDQKIKPPGGHVRPPSWWPPSRELLRDVASIACGVVIVLHETVWTPTAEPALLALAAGLLGLPLVARSGGRGG